MKKATILAAGLVLAAGLAAQAALAQTGAIGCGGGNGATIACDANGNSGTVTQDATTMAMSSTGVAVEITSTSGVPSGIEDLTPFGEAMSLSFSNVGFAFSPSGTFTLTDADGDFTLSGEAEFGSTPSLTGPVVLVLDPNFVSIGGVDDGGLLFSGSVSGVTGGLNFTLDPGTVTSMTGNFGLPNFSGGGSSTTPEPGTLLLLGSGLLGLGPLIRRKLSRA